MLSTSREVPPPPTPTKALPSPSSARFCATASTIFSGLPRVNPILRYPCQGKPPPLFSRQLQRRVGGSQLRSPTSTKEKARRGRRVSSAKSYRGADTRITKLIRAYLLEVAAQREGQSTKSCQRARRSKTERACARVAPALEPGWA